MNMKTIIEEAANMQKLWCIKLAIIFGIYLLRLTQGSPSPVCLFIHPCVCPSHNYCCADLLKQQTYIFLVPFLSEEKWLNCSPLSKVASCIFVCIASLEISGLFSFGEVLFIFSMEYFWVFFFLTWKLAYNNKTGHMI